MRVRIPDATPPEVVRLIHAAKKVVERASEDGSAAPALELEIEALDEALTPWCVY